MRYNIIILLLLLAVGMPFTVCSQLPDLAPKTTTTTPEDSMVTIDILPGVRKLEFRTIDDSTKLQILAGNVKLRQGTALFYSDSAVINNRLNTFEAWGHVHINDADTANIYSEHLRYLIQKKVAFLDGGVTLTDGKGTLTTPDLEYDMDTKIGIYKNGGKVVKEKTVLTSTEGYYYSDLKDVYFKQNVELKDPQYYIKTDSLLYNTESSMARFIAQTFIRDSSGRTIETKDGFYNLQTGKAEFGQRPVIRDGKITIIANRVAFDDSTGIAQAEGNAIIVDSTNETTIIAGSIFRNKKTEAILATRKPVMIIKQENDSIFIAADTLFSARLTDLYAMKDSLAREIARWAALDSAVHADSSRLADSLALNDSTRIAALNRDSTRTDSLGLNDSTRISTISVDSTRIDSLALNDSTRIADLQIDSKKIDSLAAKDSTRIDDLNKESIKEDSLALNDSSRIIDVKKESIKKDSLALKDSLRIDTISKLNPKELLRQEPEIIGGVNLNRIDTTIKDSLTSAKSDLEDSASALITRMPGDTLTSDTLTSKDLATLNEKDSTNRYFEAYRNVRIFSDSMQAIADSMFYSFKDSTFRLFQKPVVWSNKSQITGDTILVFTKNKKADRGKAFTNSLLVNQLDPEIFNQIKSTRMDAFFTDGNIDSARAAGLAQCIYYIQDDDSAYTGINESKSDIMDVYFAEKALHKVVSRSGVSGTIWPIKQKNPREMRLEGFKWLEDKRPKTKLRSL